MGSSELLINLDRASRVPLRQQLCDEIAAAVQAGRLRPGGRLPATRELAGELGVSRTVVVGAYELLRARGLVIARRGSATTIAPHAADPAPAAAGAPPPAPRTPLLPKSPLAGGTDGAGGLMWRPWPAPGAAGDTGPAIDFRHGTPALAEFPVSRWQHALQRAHTRASTASLGYGPAEGSAELRARITELVRRSRGLDAPPGRVVVTSGATQATDILARLLASGPGDVIVIEDPGHTVLRQIFGSSPAAAVVPVPVDHEGLRVAEIDGRVRAAGHDPGRVTLVYVTPSHQFPTGHLLSPRRRRELLAWVRRRGAVVLEDDYHNEFSFTGARLPALAAEDRHGNVVYVGSFSKTLFPALRLGYAILPERLVRPCLGVKWITDRLSPTLTQEALADFIATGAYARHISRMSRLYRRRRGHLLDTLRDRFGDRVRISGEAAGLHVLVTFTGLPRDLDEEAITARAERHGVRVHPAAGYYHAGHAARAVLPDGLRGAAPAPDHRGRHPAGRRTHHRRPLTRVHDAGPASSEPPAGAAGTAGSTAPLRRSGCSTTVCGAVPAVILGASTRRRLSSTSATSCRPPGCADSTEIISRRRPGRVATTSLCRQFQRREWARPRSSRKATSPGSGRSGASGLPSGRNSSAPLAGASRNAPMPATSQQAMGSRDASEWALHRSTRSLMRGSRSPLAGRRSRDSEAQG
ncbi:DNA-binding transcriptional regulator, MocR family, contains an aminotransferase domain [Streptomyces aidingensis]|uniref:DNA-binding transcriptional regulator, MocR family, contains an aminotransferase domain n=1 Tax=Streptomyces aidingensis TaxID=910347 RepID=A0A1I1HSD4_9ACTN|nr:PLP-dependent aminotransferase family protein [Streptomyces aidingensis]SFC27039.1 DNA-binding transcriptional regulator, MocR family, contains an aminotransferase domain [Streptomyces aidingensis]